MIHPRRPKACARSRFIASNALASIGRCSAATFPSVAYGRATMRSSMVSRPSSKISPRPSSRRSSTTMRGASIEWRASEARPSGEGLFLYIFLGPLDAVPSEHLRGRDLDQVARPVVGWHQIFRAVLAEKTHRHAVGDVEALTLHRSRTEDDFSFPLRGDPLVGPAVLRARNADVWIFLDVPNPGRALARDDPEGLTVPFLPDRGHVRHAVFVNGGDPRNHRLGQKFFHLRRRELAVLSHPFCVLFVRHLGARLALWI